MRLSFGRAGWVNIAGDANVIKSIRRSHTMLCLHMSAQVNLPLESTATGLTGEWFEPGVLATVGDQVGRLAERFPTFSTFVGLFSCKNIKRFYKRFSSHKTLK